MRCAWRRTVTPLVLLTVTACSPVQSTVTPTPARNTEAVELHRRWWTALASADTSFLRRYSSSDLIATLSSGKAFDVDSLVRTYGTSLRPIASEWADEAVRYVGSNAVVVTGQSTESDGSRPSVYRFLTVIRNTEAGWRVAAVQSTRRASFTARWNDAGALTDFAGTYRTPRGLALTLSAHEAFLTLREPSGREVRLVPIGLNLFESDFVSPDGSITRFSFGRDATGRVVSLSVLAPGVINTFPRNL